MYISLSARFTVHVLETFLKLSISNRMETYIRYFLELSMETYTVLTFLLICTRFIKRSWNIEKQAKSASILLSSAVVISYIYEMFPISILDLHCFFFHFTFPCDMPAWSWNTSYFCMVDPGCSCWYFWNSHYLMKLTAFTVVPQRMPVSHYVNFCTCNKVATFFRHQSNVCSHYGPYVYTGKEVSAPKSQTTTSFPKGWRYVWRENTAPLQMWLAGHISNHLRLQLCLANLYQIFANNL